jgi:hypothetical protein
MYMDAIAVLRYTIDVSQPRVSSGEIDSTYRLYPGSGRNLPKLVNPTRLASDGEVATRVGKPSAWCWVSHAWAVERLHGVVKLMQAEFVMRSL